MNTKSEFPDATIDLSGFGAEDFLVIALHDGYLNSDQNHNTTLKKMGSERRIEQVYATSRALIHDTAIWKSLAHTMTLRSQHSILSSSGHYSIHIVGLPSGVPDNHFVFI